MRKRFAAAVASLPLLAGSPQASAQQHTVQGWDNPAKAEFPVNNVQTRIKLGQIGSVSRTVYVDCDLLVKGRTQDGKTAVFPTAAFFAQFNAESAATWNSLPPNFRAVLEKSRNDMSISKAAIDGIRSHLEVDHGISASIVIEAGKRCKAEHFGL